MEILTPQNITFAIGMIGILFSIYNYFKNPQDALDKRTAVEKEEVEGNVALITEQLKWEREATEKRFISMQEVIRDATAMAQNHIHTVDTKVDKLQVVIEQMGKEIVRLSTVISERIPKK